MSAERQVILDTETTGLEWRQGDRVIEIGCIELVNRRQSGRRFHRYLNPQRPIGAGAQAVHGLTDEFLADKPKFADIADELLEFLSGAEVIIHNAPFDVGFLDYELSLIGRGPLATVCASITDTLKMARELRPGKKNGLDALCAEFGIDNSNRQLHGALLDAELLAEVYLAMTRGQESLMIALDGALASGIDLSGERPPIRVLAPSAEELGEHERVLAEIDKASGGKTLWRQLCA
ncbi:DNA polymerase III subunit epsilon [Sulfuricystis multivorans]|uniref:DNA polymerase III subunit epsilon n=1 Tax=Sulfuricystis multivorans TaxID=2211108 RepID=UPI000F83B221|nr:DNA polymerase III subunit epsilon [Sulfuricystis multivorans]